MVGKRHGLSYYLSMDNHKIPVLKKIPKTFWQNREWYVKRFNWYPFLLFPQVISILSHPTVKIPFSYKWAGTFCNESAEWYWDARDQLRIRKGIIAKAKKSKKYSDWFLGRFVKHFQNLEKVFSQNEKKDFNKLSDENLIGVLDQLFRAESAVAAWGYLADSFLTAGEDNWLIEEIKKETADLKAIEILTAPGFESFVNKERISLLNIGSLNKNSPKYRKSLQQHRDHYYWIQNGYWIAHIYDLEFFDKEIAKLKKKGINFPATIRIESQRVKANLLAKQAVYKNFGLSQRLQNTIYCSDMIGLVQDTRKQAALRLDHFLFLIGEQIAKRVKITRQEALNLVYPEVRDVLIHKKINRWELRNRIEKCFIYLSPKGYAILSGQKAKAINLNIFHESDSKANALKGTPAFMGLASGKVRIVNNHAEMEAFKSGEILVTNNTTPEFVPLMRKAKAIVTEQGGMTTHAAIVSRELRVPCIVGVSGITRVLKTGDKVEVDANKGIVKKI